MITKATPSANEFKDLQNAFYRRHGMVTARAVQTATEHPFLGATKLTYKDHLGPKEVSVEIKGNLWSDLWKAADAAIRASGDSHRVFVEGFRAHKTEKGVLVLSTIS